MEQHQLIKNYFLKVADNFKKCFGKCKNKKLPFQKKTHEWLNYFYSSPLFRHIHLEFYKTEKICVMHINVFPDPKIDMPILGFDMIALGNKITGLFFDYTPTFTTMGKLDKDLDNLNLNFKSTKRPLPEWADFFSNKFYCVEPDISELPSLLITIEESFESYLNLCRDEQLKYNLKVEKQNKYCQGQKRNDKTLKALSIEIGEDNAYCFLNKYLFPEIV
jgi:hypothetical protein